MNRKPGAKILLVLVGIALLLAGCARSPLDSGPTYENRRVEGGVLALPAVTGDVADLLITNYSYAEGGTLATYVTPGEQGRAVLWERLVYTSTAMIGENLLPVVDESAIYYPIADRLVALMLRNRYAPGVAMLATTFTSVPGYAREGEDIPLMSAYTIQGEDTLAVFLLSRKLGGVHDGADFGDGTTPVTLHLPITRCAALTRYALTAPDGSPADPRVNNREAENVVISSVALDPADCADGVLVVGPETGGVAGGMSEGPVYLYVFDQNTAAEAYTLTVNTVGQG